MRLSELGEQGALQRLNDILYTTTDLLETSPDLLEIEREERQPASGLHRISRSLARGVRLGPGHDAAVVTPPAGYDLVLTCDGQTAGVHFDLEIIGPEDAGRRAALAALSDLAPFGATPLWGLLSLFVPAELEIELLERFYRGLLRATDDMDLPFQRGDWGKFVFVGGDLVSTPGPLSLDVTVVGRRPSTWATGGRDGARVGDTVYLSGPTGQAAAGLWHLQHPDVDITGSEKLRKAFLTPRIELQLGVNLWRDGRLTSAADTSDSLGEQLHHLAAASAVGVMLEEAALELPEPLIAAAAAMELSPLELALGGGEDFRLLVTGPAGMERADSQLRPVGVVVEAAAGVRVQGLDGVRREPPPPLFQHYDRP